MVSFITPRYGTRPAEAQELARSLHSAAIRSGLSLAEFIVMERLSFAVAAVIDRCRAEWRSIRIARTIYPPLWESVRRKIRGSNEIELSEYARVRAAQLAQAQVDAIMQTNPALSGAFATRLLLRSTERAVNFALEAVANARRANRSPSA